MKSLSMAMALVAVLGLVGETAAEVIFEPDFTIGNPDMHMVVGDPVPLDYGLLRYTVTAYSAGEPINAIIICNIDGPVHQVWPHNGSSTDPDWTSTIFPSSLAGATWDAAWNDYDTHRLFEGSPIYYDLFGDYCGPIETNAGGAAYGGDFVAGGFEAKVGLGTLAAGDGAADTFPGAQANVVMPIVQIVLPQDTRVYLTVATVDRKENYGRYTGVPIGVPEPSTLALLAAGGACLLACRRRRR